jgi:hypothetical protein
VNRPLQRFQKDAVIALAILVVLLLFWRLLMRPQRLGTYGPRLKTIVFGPLGIRVGETLVPASGQGRAQAIPQPQPTAEPTPPVPLTDSGSGAGGIRSESAESLVTNPPLKVVALLPDDETGAALTNSPNAALLAQRLDEARAKTGDIQFSLFWGNRNDLDLHCIDPAGEHIFYSHRKSQATGGELDVDRNASAPFTDRPIENIYWPVGGAPPGVYKVCVVHYNRNGGRDPTAFTVRTVVSGKTNYFQRAVSCTGRREMYWVCSIQYDASNPDPARRCRFLSFR